MAVISRFSASWGTFVTLGDGSNDDVVISRSAAGTLLVNGGAVPVVGGTPTVANVRVMQLLGQGGDDVLRLDESNGALPAALLQGGDGNDVMTGGSGGDTLRGGNDNDSLFGRGGVDALYGDAGNDVLVGGDGNDQMFGGAGDDRLVWNPGDDSDLFEGGDGSDSAEVNGGNGAEQFTITANGTRVRFDRVDPAPFALDIGSTESLVLNANGGDDVVSAGNGLSALIRLTVDGGAGNDSITGGDGNDLLLGGDGNDSINGGRGVDTALLGAGDDRFVWNPGDGSDVVEGQSGTDTLQFNGANINEIFDIGANGGRVLFTRNVAAIAMDLNSVERIELQMLGGTDRLTVGDTGGTGLAEVVVNMAAAGGADDGAADSVVVNGSTGNDVAQVLAGAGGPRVTGLGAAVEVTGAGAGVGDQLHVLGGEGADTLDARASGPVSLQLVLDGGNGNDELRAGGGDNLLLGGADNDVLAGGDGNDLMFGEAGNDRLIWNPGDDSDLFEGGDGTDSAEVNGGNGAEQFSITANGTRVRLDRVNPAPFTLDIGTTEQLVLNANGGDDVITAGNGLSALISLRVDGGIGNDSITGGDGADLLLGGDGNDSVSGGRGADTALLGSGDDRFTWNPGDGSDIIEGQSGTDTHAFNGANISEAFNIFANGGRVVFTRNVGSIVMDQNDVERIELAALGGADNVTVDDLSGTDLVEMVIDLRASGGGGDGAADTVTLRATAGDDVVVVSMQGSDMIVTGLASTVVLRGFEPGLDRLLIEALAGDDVIEGSGATLPLELFGGDGDDILLGGSADDQLFGGVGDDILVGNAGLDLLDGGPGNNVLIQ